MSRVDNVPDHHKHNKGNSNGICRNRTHFITITVFLLRFSGSGKTGSKLKKPQLTFHRIYSSGRANRAHLNTGEWVDRLVCPMLVMCGYFWDPKIAAGIGVLWILGRFMYRAGYMKGWIKPIQRLSCCDTSLVLLLMIGGDLRHCHKPDGLVRICPTFPAKRCGLPGASSGIGEALAKSFANAGAHIILSGRRIGALEEVATAISTDTLILPFETTDYDGLASCVETAWTWKGRVDILVNNAGITQRGLAIHTDPKVYTDLINIDLICADLADPITAKPDGRSGRRPYHRDQFGLQGGSARPLRTAYSAAKHGLIGYMDALRSEVELRHNIRVTNVLRGFR